MRPERLYVTGLPGSGKSTVGPLVARRLGWAFVDLDRLLEQRAHRSIAEIFAREGEWAFRALERELLEESAGWIRHVIATGGGTLAQPGLMDWALEHGWVVYLRAWPELLRQRTAHEERPLLRYRSLEELWADRDPIYMRAHRVYDAALAPDLLAEAIACEVRARIEGQDVPSWP
ncbi:MAG: shikimate kinase [Bacteroidetes bacterium]|nr:shikimate kinase [Rhodothermia bacterium]MCS7155532.1 shikimate kinase [Bacteroidota bacterium]MCX7907375.1 shikimate kinase [Bacteroidota bacterium]MDW8138369.1 shikimate kinase [Bacteroidota bacterium]MDW8284694.1 shikimate kinase [Bacteroidota bacterium]